MPVTPACIAGEHRLTLPSPHDTPPPPTPVCSSGLRWKALAGYWAAQAVVMFIATILVFGQWPPAQRDFDEALGDKGFLLVMAVCITGITLLQAAFMLPVRRPRSLVRGEAVGSRARWCAAVVGGAGLGLLAAALAVCGMEFAESALGAQLSANSAVRTFWCSWAGVAVTGTLALVVLSRRGLPAWVSLLIAMFGAAALAVATGALGLEVVEQVRGSDLNQRLWAWSLLAIVLVAWGAGTPLLLAFMKRGPRETQLSRLASLLLIGTVAEAAATIPLDAMVRKRSSCHCGEGTFWTLVICGAVGFWALGPAVFLLPLGRRRKRHAQGRCEACGYDLRGTPGTERCPECGAGWRSSHEC
jgi:hypothetical protein